MRDLIVILLGSIVLYLLTQSYFQSNFNTSTTLRNSFSLLKKHYIDLPKNIRMIQSRTHNSLSIDNKQEMLKYMDPLVNEISNSIGYPVKILDINRIDSYTKGVYHVITVLYNKKTLTNVQAGIIFSINGNVINFHGVKEINAENPIEMPASTRNDTNVPKSAFSVSQPLIGHNSSSLHNSTVDFDVAEDGKQSKGVDRNCIIEPDSGDIKKERFHCRGEKHSWNHQGILTTEDACDKCPGINTGYGQSPELVGTNPTLGTLPRETGEYNQMFQLYNAVNHNFSRSQ